MLFGGAAFESDLERHTFSGYFARNLRLQIPPTSQSVSTQFRVNFGDRDGSNPVWGKNLSAKSLRSADAPFFLEILIGARIFTCSVMRIGEGQSSYVRPVERIGGAELFDPCAD